MLHCSLLQLHYSVIVVVSKTETLLVLLHSRRDYNCYARESACRHMCYESLVFLVYDLCGTCSQWNCSCLSATRIIPNNHTHLLRLTRGHTLRRLRVNSTRNYEFNICSHQLAASLLSQLLFIDQKDAKLAAFINPPFTLTPAVFILCE